MIDWSVALLPVLILLAVFIWLDAFKLMTFWETLGLLLLGGIAALAAYPLSGVFLDQLPIGFSNYSRFVAPWIEEALKALVIVSLFRFNRIGFKLDAVISGFAVGAGFSVVENVIYLWRFPDLVVSIWMVRGLGTAVMHGMTLAVLAATVHEFAERETRQASGKYDFSPFWFVPGFLAAVAIHTLFNQFPDRPLLAMIATLVLAPIVVIGIFRFGSGEAEQWLRQDKEDHRRMLEALRSGAFPDDVHGVRVAALADRSGVANRERIREYWELTAALVLTAESTLLKQSAEEARTSADAGAAFARRAELKRALGPSLVSVLESLLPFSRNDYWELSELRERYRRS